MSNDATLVLRKRGTYIDRNLRPWKSLAMSLCPQTVLYQHLANRTGAIFGAVLEVGFGTGSQVAQYVHLANHVTAMEVDPKAIVFAKNHWPMPRVEWIEADICYFDAPKVYDTIICIEVLEHVADPFRAMKNMAVALKPGGFAWFSVPTGQDKNELHRNTWTAEEFEAELLEHFEQVRIELTHPIIFAECSYA